jgi:hypothetical protein
MTDNGAIGCQRSAVSRLSRSEPAVSGRAPGLPCSGRTLSSSRRLTAEGYFHAKSKTVAEIKEHYRDCAADLVADLAGADAARLEGISGAQDRDSKRARPAGLRSHARSQQDYSDRTQYRPLQFRNAGSRIGPCAHLGGTKRPRPAVAA